MAKGCDADRAVPMHGGDAPRGIQAVAGTLSGAGLGFAVAGYAGLTFGGIAGLIIGASASMMNRSEDE